MNRWFGMALVAGCCLASSPIIADPPTDVMTIVRDQDIRWTPEPSIPGLQTATIAGDPRVPGQPYVIRAKFAPGAFSPPHFHPEARYIVVLKGTWWVGAGPKWDRDATTPLPVGTAVVHHAHQIHYDGAKGEEVVVQIVGVGPTAMVKVDETGQPLK